MVGKDKNIMELWIRSQSKTSLNKVNGVYYGAEGEFWAIYEKGENFDYLGLYTTKERCLEIIDEIQEILTHNGMILFKNVDISEIPPVAFEPFKGLSYLPNGDTKSEVTIHNAEVVVYEMPEE